MRAAYSMPLNPGILMALAECGCFLYLFTPSFFSPFKLTLVMWHQNMPSPGPLELGVVT